MRAKVEPRGGARGSVPEWGGTQVLRIVQLLFRVRQPPQVPESDSTSLRCGSSNHLCDKHSRQSAVRQASPPRRPSARKPCPPSPTSSPLLGRPFLSRYAPNSRNSSRLE